MTGKLNIKKRRTYEERLEENIQNWEKKTQENIQKWEEVSDEMFKRYERKTREILRKWGSQYSNAIEKMNATLLEVGQFLEEAQRVSRLSKKKLEDFEESLMYIMHNIKRNQFLYAHYPEEWVENYLSIKDGLKAENEFMSKKGAI